MKRFVLVAIGLAVLAGTAVGQYTPTAAQHQKLTKQKEKVLRLQVEIVKLQAEQSFEAERLERLCRAVALENNWPSNVDCNLANLGFVAIAPPVPLPQPQPQQPPAAKPEEKKP